MHAWEQGMKSKAITVRNLPPEVAKAIRDRARRKGWSVNRAVTELLVEATSSGENQKKTRQLHHDLDKYFGVWRREERDSFDEDLRSQRVIEPELWK
ncbi:MAG: hypothetical protein M3P29_00055 [Acidobacteriota bacterium]|nr:hypothetical protein [Acidobacteriota bacterium]